LLGYSTAAQLERIAACGTTRNVAAATTVVEQGDATMPFIVVLSGELEIVRPAPGGDEVVAVHKAGNLFGDIVMLSGRRSMVIARMRVAGQLIEMQREALQQLVQTDGELGAQFEGNGIYYGATFVEAQLCQGEEVIVVGGGNSAGQAAIFLSDCQPRTHSDPRCGPRRYDVQLPGPPHRAKPRHHAS
jgi:hypothetical protein